MSEANDLRSFAETLVSKSQIGEMINAMYPTVMNFLEEYNIQPVITVGRSSLYNPQDIIAALRIKYNHILTVLGYIEVEEN